MKKSFKVKAKVWIWPGVAAWHFINLDQKTSEKIRSVYTKGFVRINAKIGKTEWKTALFPHKESKSYLISIKKSVRKIEDIWTGDIVSISFNIL